MRSVAVILGCSIFTVSVVGMVAGWLGLPYGDWAQIGAAIVGLAIGFWADNAPPVSEGQR